MKFPIPLDKVFEISKTLRPNSIENFKDLMAQWYRKFQRLYGPMVSEISKTFLSKGIGNFKDLKAQWYWKFQRSLKFPIALGKKVFEISDTIGP